MAARTGKEYITGLRERAVEVYIGGERVKDVTTHPTLRNGVRTLASLYDMQRDPVFGQEMTYSSPTSGEQVGLSFITPRSKEDLERRHTREVQGSQGLFRRCLFAPRGGQPRAN